MSKIKSLRADHYLIPLETVLTDSMHGAMSGFEIVTARVRDADGMEGVGYTFTCGVNGGAIADILGREMPSRVVGEDADRIEHIWTKLWWAFHYGGRGGPTVFALSALDMALWDLKAKRANQPLWKLLGGFDNKVPCYAGGIDLDLSASELIEQTEANFEKGHHAIKMKVGRDRLAEDVEKIAAMRDRFGMDMPLMVDANMKYTVDQAIRAARAFAEFDLTWFEEPIPPDDLEGHARVVREGGLPLAAGENLRTLWDFKSLIASGGVTFPEPDVTNCGGITPFMKIAHLAEAFHLPVTSHGAHDITVHLLAACPNRSYLEAHGFGLDNYVEEAVRIEDGHAIAADRPGHGVAFDWEQLEKIRV
ncbi:mandelate racemase/muconate lactonizing enzyme family protein [Alisedimentitalea sp. MJ-SS2]|uniref:mandelate racemase/muconate lactonizing enzyme family protein n=1 Tax=Aliisedimentitalea sp. MJ-SS2 TaxID=3049795 RepID=UPI00290E1EE4|nr:mandelate racemase/muconate lactonizing enzyme family protein [Alisedimentitalea sp. MJ-SS2]MDU8927066.1 mandelate racemase/muconate lactonizing enzyme family protein [Alisedimentitalea sp. MJ-SS2]